tara:strand:- start:41566 stop:41694 length:129 start_codon:yes stop_codon:yes gene_type:complete
MNATGKQEAGGGTLHDGNACLPRLSGKALIHQIALAVMFPPF